MLCSSQTFSAFTPTAVSELTAGERRGEDLDPDLLGSKTVPSTIILPVSEQLPAAKTQDEAKQEKLGGNEDEDGASGMATVKQNSKCW